jgi:hypothetical protein
LDERNPQDHRAGGARPKILSIVGAGHSGSTVLDIVLGNDSRVVGVGELHKLPRSGWVHDDDRRCACGSPIHLCPYWLEVRERWNDRCDGQLERYVALQDRFEGSGSTWPRLLVDARRRTAAFRRYAEMTAALYEAIGHVSDKPIVVDSSKKPIHAYALLLNPHLDVRVIHLVRDGRGIVWSKSKSLRRDVEAGVPRDRHPVSSSRSTAHWILANLESEIVVARAGRSNALRISYEAFVARPIDVLRAVGALAGEDLGVLGEAVAAGRPMQTGHKVGGNRVRRSGSLCLRPDLRWTTDLPPRDARTFWRMAGWLARRYGYARSPARGGQG